jgi:hypothetical protein
MMDDMKISSEFECPQECNTVKLTIREKLVPIDPNLFCPKPKSLWISINLNLRVSFIIFCLERRICY